MDSQGISQTFDDIESDDPSLDTSVPTDMTISPDHSEREACRSKRKKELLKRKQLLHETQGLKAELSQKNRTIQSLEAEHSQRVEELEDRLQDVMHQKQILQARLESELQAEQEEANRRQKMVSRELELVRTKQQHLEAANDRLREKAGDVWNSLKDLSLSEEKYYELRGLSEQELSLRDYVAVRLFEGVRPLQSEVNQLRMACQAEEEQVADYFSEIVQLKKRLEEEHQAHAELRVMYQKVSQELADTKTQVKTEHYKVDNYDRVKCERDVLEQDCMDVQRQLAILEGSHGNLQNERDDLVKELSTATQSVMLLKQDKEYLTRQLADTSSHSTFAEERLQQLSRQLDDAKRSREEMYEKYVTCREQYKAEYESKLREELEQVRFNTNAEIERLRLSGKEMFERESRNLREARDVAVAELEKVQLSEREIHTKYEQLSNQFGELQSKSESRVSDVQNELRVKAFEAERLQLVHEETVTNLKDSQMQVEKLHAKAEMLRKEYSSMHTVMEKRISELQTQLTDNNRKLNTYEQLEKDMDDAILQAANTEDEQEAEKVLLAFDQGSHAPGMAKGRLQHSVHLAQRLLQLERANTVLRKEVVQERTKASQLAEELQKSTAVLELAKQPHSYLIDSIRSQDSHVQQQHKDIVTLQKNVRSLEEEREWLMSNRKEMTQDLQHLLNQQQEVALMKQVVREIATQGPHKTPGKDDGRPKSASVHTPVVQRCSSSQIQDDLSVDSSSPLSLVRAHERKARSSPANTKVKKKGKGQVSSVSKMYGYATQ